MKNNRESIFLAFKEVFRAKGYEITDDHINEALDETYMMYGSDLTPEITEELLEGCRTDQPKLNVVLYRV